MILNQQYTDDVAYEFVRDEFVRDEVGDEDQSLSWVIERMLSPLLEVCFANWKGGCAVDTPENSDVRELIGAKGLNG